MWISTVHQKPVIDTSDKWNEDHKLSERVVIWLEGEERANFATYNHSINHWSAEGYMGFDQSRVKYFMYINTPYKKIIPNMEN